MKIKFSYSYILFIYNYVSVYNIKKWNYFSAAELKNEIVSVYYILYNIVMVYLKSKIKSILFWFF